MKSKEAIETIKVAIAEVEWNYPMDYTIAFETAIEALKKQVPKKPAVNMAEYGVCPTCGRSIDTDYCIYCGQRIDWSET